MRHCWRASPPGESQSRQGSNNLPSTYFPDIDACLQATASYIGERILRVVRTARQDLSGSPLALAQGFAGALTVLTEDAIILELVLRHRRSPGLLGETLRALQQKARNELEEDLLSSGLTTDPEQARMWSFVVVQFTLTAAEGLLDGELPSPEVATRLLAQFAFVGLQEAR